MNASNSMNPASNIIIISSKNSDVVGMVNGKVSKIRNGNTSPIKYTIFSYYAQYAKQLCETDWETLFNNAARGSFIKGFKFIDEKFLSIKTTSGFQKIDVIPSAYTPQIFHMYYMACKEFISRTSAMFNALDDDSEFAYIPQGKKEDGGWSGTISAVRQVTMINAFVREEGVKYRLSDQQIEDLIGNLTAKVFIGDIKGEDIKCESLRIIAIDGLTFTDGNFHMVTKPIKPQIKGKSKTTATVQEVVQEDKVFKSSVKLSLALKRRYELMLTGSTSVK